MEHANIRVAVYQDGAAWIAQCLDHDICVQAPDVSTLTERFNAVLRADYMESLERTGVPFGGIGPAPAFIRQQHERLEAGFTSSGFIRGKNEEAVEYEMALCA